MVERWLKEVSCSDDFEYFPIYHSNMLLEFRPMHAVASLRHSPLRRKLLTLSYPQHMHPTACVRGGCREPGSSSSRSTCSDYAGWLPPISGNTRPGVSNGNPRRCYMIHPVRWHTGGGRGGVIGTMTCQLLWLEALEIWLGCLVSVCGKCILYVCILMFNIVKYHTHMRSCLPYKSYTGATTPCLLLNFLINVTIVDQFICGVPISSVSRWLATYLNNILEQHTDLKSSPIKVILPRMLIV